MGLTAQQEKAVQAQSSVSVTAGAGTGKTYMLAERYLHHLRQGLSPLQIVAMTFTDKAATELRMRIRGAIADQFPERFDWLAAVEAAQISTFHTVAKRICQEHPEAAGIPAHFEIMDDWEGQIWQQETLTKLLTELPIELSGNLTFSHLKGAIIELLRDPLTAKIALQKNSEHWLPLLKQKQQHIIENIFHSDCWNHTKDIIRTYYGKAGDKLEQIRQTFGELMVDLEAQKHQIEGEFFQRSLTSIVKFSVGNAGSKSNWESQETLKKVRSQIIACRDFLKYYPDIHILSLSWGESEIKEAAQVEILKQAFVWIQERFQELKWQERFLDFNDLEIYALKALEKDEVRNYYQKRWKAYLIDEFQDTNPTQGNLLEALTQAATVTIVGDDKQSIYGFRQADIKVFQAWRSKSLNQVNLTTSFRTHHALIQQLNILFKPVLGEKLHQDLDANRREAPNSLEFFEVYNVEKTKDISLAEARKIEANHIAKLIHEMIQQKITVWNKKTNKPKEITYEDIAILLRASSSFDIYSNALAQWNIPCIASDGGNLLETREVQDAIAFLQFLANPYDDLALVALLRSPFFAVSDRRLYELRPQGNKRRWWQQLQDSQDSQIIDITKILKILLKERHKLAPSRLLQLGDRHTGYTAVIANLPQAQRRLADWGGFLELIRKLETGMADVLTVVRSLQRFKRHNLKIPRPPLEAENAVSLMTIHKSKGLEWSVVIVPDLTRSKPNIQQNLLFNPDYGVALKQSNADGESEKTALFQLLETIKKEEEEAEAKRILYVACTRARDRLILTAPSPSGGDFNLLKPTLEEHIQIQAIAPEIIPQEIEPISQPHIATQSPQLLLGKATSNGLELPMTSLSIYDRCPQQFYWQYIEGHPGFSEGESTSAAAIGNLTHIAIEKNLFNPEQLASYNREPILPQEKVLKALEFAQNFREAPTFQAVQSGEKEQELFWEYGHLQFNGRADLIGEDFVLDIKTDEQLNPLEHRFQLWIYARAAGKTTAHIAYVQQQELFSFSQTDLSKIDQEAQELLTSLSQNHYPTKPEVNHCQYCPYRLICEDRATE